MKELFLIKCCADFYEVTPRKSGVWKTAKRLRSASMVIKAWVMFVSIKNVEIEPAARFSVFIIDKRGKDDQYNLRESKESWQIVYPSLA